MGRLLLLVALGACAEEEPEPLPLSPCRLSDAATLAVAHAEWDFGQIPSGATIVVQTAPQGGGLFSEFELLAGGLDAAYDLDFVMRATRTSDSVVVGNAFTRPKRFICSNVDGVTYGKLVGAKQHVFYGGFLPEDLEGQAVRFDFEATDAGGRQASTTFDGTLTYVF